MDGAPVRRSALLCSAELRGVVRRLGFTAALCWIGRGAGGSWAVFIGRRSALGVRSREGKPAENLGVPGAAVARGR